MTSNRGEISSRDSGDRISATDRNSRGSSSGGHWRPDRDASGSGSTTPKYIKDLLRGIRGDSQSTSEDITEQKRTRLGDYIKYRLISGDLTPEGLLSLRSHETTDPHIKLLDIHREDIMAALANHLHQQLDEYKKHPDIYPPLNTLDSIDGGHNIGEFLANARDSVNFVIKELKKKQYKQKNIFGKEKDDRNEELKTIVGRAKDLHRQMKNLGRTPRYSETPLYEESARDLIYREDDENGPSPAYLPPPGGGEGSSSQS